MESVFIRVIVNPIINSDDYEHDFPIFEEEIKMTVGVKAGTLMKDFRQVVMNHIGLDHLYSTSEAFFLSPHANSYINIAKFGDLSINVGMLTEMAGDFCLFKVVATGTLEDFSGIVGRNHLFQNLAKLLVKKFPFIKENEDIPEIKNITQSIDDSSIITFSGNTLFQMNETLIKELSILKSKEEPIQVEVPTTSLDNSSVSKDKEENINVNVKGEPFQSPLHSNLKQGPPEDLNMSPVVSPPPKRIKNNREEALSKGSPTKSTPSCRRKTPSGRKKRSTCK